MEKKPQAQSLESGMEVVEDESSLESAQGIQANSCAVHESLMAVLASRDETPLPNQEGHASTASSSMLLSSSDPQRHRNEAVSMPTCSFTP